MLYVLLKFSQNRSKKILFSSRLKKGQEKTKRPNHFISRKLFQKRPNGNPGREETWKKNFEKEKKKEEEKVVNGERKRIYDAWLQYYTFTRPPDLQNKLFISGLNLIKLIGLYFGRLTLPINKVRRLNRVFYKIVPNSSFRMLIQWVSGI
jgi:hypothetical protein